MAALCLSYRFGCVTPHINDRGKQGQVTGRREGKCDDTNKREGDIYLSPEAGGEAIHTTGLEERQLLYSYKSNEIRRRGGNGKSTLLAGRRKDGGKRMA